MIKKKHLIFGCITWFACAVTFSCIKKVAKPIGADAPPVVLPPGAVDTCTTGVKYAKQIAPILSKSCAKPTCHVPLSPGTPDFSTYTAFKVEVDIRGATYIYNRIKTGFDMPLTGTPLTACEISKMKAWMEEGALNN